MGGGLGGKVSSRRPPRGKISIVRSSVHQIQNTGKNNRTCFSLRMPWSTWFPFPRSSSTSPCGQQILSDLIATSFPLCRPFQTSAAPPKAQARDPSATIPSSITYEDGNLACARHILLRRTKVFLCSLFVLSFELVACDSFGWKGFRNPHARGKDACMDQTYELKDVQHPFYCETIAESIE